MVEVNRAVVLLVHGSPGSPRSWDGVVEELTLRRPEVEVRRLAIPGWDQRTPSAVEQLDFEQIIDRLAGQVGSEVRPNLLVGFSAGALFAMGLAAQGLWPLEGLLLLEPMGLPALELVGRESECHAIRAAFEAYFSGVDQAIPDAIRSIMDVWYPAGSYEAMPKPVKDYLQAWAPLNVRDGRAALDARYDPDWFSHLAMPTIATYGTAGPPVWQHFAEAIAQLLPAASPRPVMGATHTILDTHVSDVTDLIEELLPSGDENA